MSIIRYRSKRYRKRIIIAISIFIILIPGFFLYGLTTKYQEIKGKYSLDREVIINGTEEAKPKVKIQTNVFADDLKIHSYSNIKLTDKLLIGDYVDIRIRFTNGMNFIVLPKKRVVDLSIVSSNNNLDNTIWLEVSAEEILRMSSAFADIQTHEGCYIYIVQYLNEIQKAAIANYPVMNEVRKLIDNDPNVTKKGDNLQEYPYRNEIDVSGSSANMILNEEVSLEGERNYSSTQADTNYTSLKEEQEDIVYLD